MGMLDMLTPKIPEGTHPIMQPDVGRQRQHDGYCGRLEAAGIVQSMSRKGGCIGDGAAGQVLGHIKDESFRSGESPDFDTFKSEPEDYIAYRNSRRGKVKLKGLTPEEFRNQSPVAYPPINHVQV